MSTAPAALHDPGDASPPLTEVQRVADTFFAPSKTFADIRHNRSWWLPFLLMVVFGYVFSGTLIHRLGPAGIADSALRASPKSTSSSKNCPPNSRPLSAASSAP